MRPEIDKLLREFSQAQYVLGISNYGSEGPIPDATTNANIAYDRLVKAIDEIDDKAWKYDDLCK